MSSDNQGFLHERLPDFIATHLHPAQECELCTKGEGHSGISKAQFGTIIV